MAVELNHSQGTTIFDRSVPGLVGVVIPSADVPNTDLPPQAQRREGGILLPAVSQGDLIRHYTALSKLNHSIGKDMYPLGSCTMKYNPRFHEEVAALEGFAGVHPDQPEETIQGSMEVLYGLQEYLAAITGMEATTLSPMGGAQGELAGVMIIKAYHENNGEGDIRRKMLVPDSAHGTNPATAAMAGYEVVKVGTTPDGDLDLEDLLEKMGDGTQIAGLMATQPNTLGLFDRNLKAASDLLHEKGALVYGDGANMNALLGQALPRELGVDVIHINTHKPFTTPHGGGGPGAGPVMVVEKLAKFLPGPIVVKDAQGIYRWHTPDHSIGRLSGKFGNVAVLLRAYSYIRTMGEDGLRRVSRVAVENANYVMRKLEEVYPRQYGQGRLVMHEAVINANPKGRDLRSPAISVAKALIDEGFHPPTVEFPLIVKHALMIEPTETEGIGTLDRFVAAMIEIARMSQKDLDAAPRSTPVGRLDETKAAREPVLKWTPPQGEVVFEAPSE